MTHLQRKPRLQGKWGALGFTITETVIAAAAGAVVIGGGGLALRTVSASVAQSGQLESLRTDLTSAKRFLRSEVQQSQFIIVTGRYRNSGIAHTDFRDPRHPEYQSRLNQCKALAGDAVFNPMFGLKIAESIYPVVYGLGVSSKGNGYALMRCGEALNANGRYENKAPILTPLLENIGSVPCPEASKSCQVPTNADGKPLTPSEIVAGVDTSLDGDNWSQQQSFMQPALAIKTDKARKLLKILVPADKKNPLDLTRYSFLQLPGNSSGQDIEIDLIAYTKIGREVVASPVEDSTLFCKQGSLCELYSIPITSTNLAFVLDSSQSMNSCVGVIKSGCRKRIDVLKDDMRNLLNKLPETATVSILAFNKGTKSWQQGNQMPLTAANRTSALDFINSLKPNYYTVPWPALESAFANKSADTLFFVTDGLPSQNLNGGNWGTAEESQAISHFLNINNARIGNRLTVHSISIVQESPWLQQLSAGASGTYKLIQ